MLIEDVRNSIKQLKQLDIIESVNLDAEKKTKNDSNYTELVSDFYVSMNKLSYSSRELNFFPTKETLQLAEEAIEKLTSVVSSGVVDENELGFAKHHINKKVNTALSKDWKMFHQKRTSSVLNKIATVRSLSPDEKKLDTIMIDISNATDWTGLSLSDDGKRTRLELLKSGIDVVDHIEAGLNISEEVKDFIVLVSRGKARATDLTDSIVKWIKEEGLEDRFVIGFMNS